jgi:dolichyl-phosphate-mannose--protein O-mannosyl transferase
MGEAEVGRTHGRLEKGDLCHYIALFLAALVIIGWRLTEPGMLYFDEEYFVPSARGILNGSELGEVTHPPLVKELIAFCIYLFGDRPLAWRLPSCVSGIGLVLVVRALLVRWECGRLISTFGAMLLLLDGLCLTQARIAMLTTPSLFFAFFSLFCLDVAMRCVETGKRAFLWMGLSGISIGASCACKFTGVPFFVLMLAILAAAVPRRGGRVIARLGGFLLCAATLTYVVAYLPIRGFLRPFWWGVWRYQEIIVHHHTVEAVSPHGYQSQWWSWPLSLRPVWYGFEEVAGPEVVRGVMCLANPFVSLFVLLSVLVALGMGITKKRLSYEAKVCLGAFLVNLLPWVVGTRVAFYHYYYPSLVCGVLLGCVLIREGRKTFQRVVMGVSSLVAGILGICFYPLWTALPISRSWYEGLLWLTSWR